MLLFCFAQSQIDVKLQLTDSERIEFESILCDKVRKKAEIKTMKIIHDLKNPILAVEELVKDGDDCKEDFGEIQMNSSMVDKYRRSSQDLPINNSKSCINCNGNVKNLKSEINSEITDLLEMLENLKTAFKVGQKMDILEEKSIINTNLIIKSICLTHKKLASNGFNKQTVYVYKFFPKNLYVQKTLLKRVVNNIISNSLKHTQCGNVEISFNQTSEVNTTCSTLFINQIHVGSDLIPNKNYLLVQITDTGKGIPPTKLNSIFADQQSDQSKMNWDGTGLGLPICSTILSEAGGFIRYWSVEGRGSQFCIFQPHEVEVNGLDDQYHNDLVKVITDPNLGVNVHSCNEVIIAEDNNNIMRKQENILTKNKIAFQSFSNGKACYEQIKLIDCQKCSKSLILTDQMMPQMTGNEMTKLIRMLSIAREFKVVLITAEDEELNSEHNQLFDYIFNKPMPLNKLKELQHKIQQEN